MPFHNFLYILSLPTERKATDILACNCLNISRLFCGVRGSFYESDFDALRPVLITDSTSEIADDPEKPNTVKFTWRYAKNRIAQRNPLGVGIFTEPYDFTFR